MPADLVERCIAARNGGADFPTVWQTVLRLDPLVLGVPMQMISDGNLRLEIRLFPGQVSSSIRSPKVIARALSTTLNPFGPQQIAMAGSWVICHKFQH
jgi:hypothetical protein